MCVLKIILLELKWRISLSEITDSETLGGYKNVYRWLESELKKKQWYWRNRLYSRDTLNFIQKFSLSKYLLRTYNRNCSIFDIINPFKFFEITLEVLV